MTSDNLDSGFDADIAIVGYGPSGLSAANFLGSLGVSAIAFERDHEIYPRARAVTVNDWTMRCYQTVGLDEDLLKVMDPTTVLRWITYEGKELMRVKIKPSTLGQPSSSMIYQPAMEEVLRGGVERYSNLIQVRFGMSVTDFVQDTKGVTVTATNIRTGEVTTTRARYLLACDGGQSGIRTKLGVNLVGTTVDTRWVVIDAKVKRWWPERHLLTFWSDKRRPVVDIPLALGNHRWEFPLEPNESQDDFQTHEQLWKLLKTMGVSPENVEIHQHAFYKHHVRHAERWRVKRVFLLGDAGHLMPPWAGSGMQSGIRDAFNICWKLAQVIKGKLPDSLLDTYESERAPNVAEITQISEQMGRVIKLQMKGREKLEAFIGMLLYKLGLPLPDAPIAKPPTLEKGWLRGPIGKRSAVGQMIPQPRISTTTGKQGPLDNVLSNGFALIGDHVDPVTFLSTKEKSDWDALGAKYIALRSGSDSAKSETDIFDLNGSLLDWMRKHRTKVIAVRPDFFVAAAHGTGLGVPNL
jgi:3-(3-hydroxy-phenyl)propionate hydroxylase